MFLSLATQTRVAIHQTLPPTHGKAIEFWEFIDKKQIF